MEPRADNGDLGASLQEALHLAQGHLAAADDQHRFASYVEKDRIVAHNFARVESPSAQLRAGPSLLSMMPVLCRLAFGIGLGDGQKHLVGQT